jgi:hypothetical protein
LKLKTGLTLKMETSLNTEMSDVGCCGTHSVRQLRIHNPCFLYFIRLRSRNGYRMSALKLFKPALENLVVVLTASLYFQGGLYNENDNNAR